MNTTIKIAIQAIVLVALTACLTFAGPAAAPSGSTPSASDIKASMDKTPSAVFPQLKFEFDPVFEGTEIKHDFVIENKGDAPLVITKIRPD